MSEGQIPEESATVQDIVNDLERQLGAAEEETVTPDLKKALGFLEMAESFLKEADSEITALGGLSDELVQLAKLRDQLQEFRNLISAG